MSKMNQNERFYKKFIIAFVIWILLFSLIQFEESFAFAVVIFPLIACFYLIYDYYFSGKINEKILEIVLTVMLYGCSLMYLGITIIGAFVLLLKILAICTGVIFAMMTPQHLLPNNFFWYLLISVVVVYSSFLGINKNRWYFTIGFMALILAKIFALPVELVYSPGYGL